MLGLFDSYSYRDRDRRGNVGIVILIVWLQGPPRR
jgi:hypothetical protein